MTNLGKKKKPYWIFTLIVLILLALLWFAFMKAINFTNTHTFQKQRILSMQWKLPLHISKKEDKVVEKFKPIEFTAEISTPLQKYICDKFGPMDCKVALGVAQAESNFREDALNKNTDGSFDVGVFQVNSVHWKQKGCSLQELVFANSNVDCAYDIWKASGNRWTAWSTFQNGSYLAFVK